MLITEFEHKGSRAQGYQVGRFIVLVCCKLKSGERHTVIHMDSKESIICGLTSEEALYVAGMVSTYSVSEPDGTDWGTLMSQLGKPLKSWLIMYKMARLPYSTMYELEYKELPKPRLVSPGENLEFAQYTS